MKELLKQLREQLGTSGMTGVVLLVLAGAFLILTLQPLERETAFMHSRLDTAHSKVAMQARTFSVGNRQKELGEFFASLPAEQDVTDVLASIYAAASATGVELKQAEYTLDAKDKSRMAYGMVFPVQGDYMRIRLFVSSVLANNPAIALDQINFQRDRINDSTVKAEIRLTLFLRPITGSASHSY
jgi:Tfp pilus assembly protein PilO